MEIELTDQLIPGLPDEVARECLLRVPYTVFPTSRSVCKLWSDEVSSPAFHHLRRATNLSHPLIVMLQSESSSPVSTPAPEPNKQSSLRYQLTVYSPATGNWSTLPPVPSMPHGLPLFCQVVAAGTNLVVVGGWDPVTWAASEKVFIFDFLAASWRKGQAMPGLRRSFFACASDGEGLVFVAGGHDDEKNALKSAMVYSVQNDRWVLLPDMVKERDEGKGVYLAGEFVVFGGYSTENQGQFGKSAERFAVGRWGWGEVDEEALEVGVCPRTCVGSSKGRVFRCRRGKVEEGLAGGGWREAAELPEGVKVAPWIVPVGEEELMVVGSACHGGEHEGWLVGVEDGRWRKVLVPAEYSGHVQAGCCLFI